MKILLASSSIYRRELMDQLHIHYEHTAPKTDEAELKKNYRGPIEELPAYLAQKKAESVLDKNPSGITIGCDQMAIFEGQGLDKPGSVEGAVKQLLRMQGKTHTLHTALAIHCAGEWKTSTTITTMHMKPLTEQQIRDYVTLDNPIDCAGSYKIEKNGSNLFSEVENFDPSAIVGLPVMELLDALEHFGVELP